MLPMQDRGGRDMKDDARRPRKVFRVHKRARFFARLRIGIFCFLAVASLVIPWFVPDPHEVAFAWVMSAAYCLVFLALVADAISDARRYAQVVEIDAQGITVSGPGRRRTSMAWKEIDRIVNCPVRGWVELVDKRPRRVRIEYKLHGLHLVMRTLYDRWFSHLPPCLARCDSTSLFRFIWSAHAIMAFLAYVTSSLSLVLIFHRWRLDVRLHDDLVEIKHLLFFSRRYRYGDIVSISLRSRRGPAVALGLRNGKTVWLRYIQEGELGLYNSLREFWTLAKAGRHGAAVAERPD